MSACEPPARRAVAVVLAVFLSLPGVALSHGGEDEALEEMPARALAQQALALLSEDESAVEAHERVEAALASSDQTEVDVSKLRQAQAAFGDGDHALAARALNEALADRGRSDSAGDRDEAGHGGMEEGEASPADVATDVSSFEHTREFEPERGALERVALVLGAAALALGGGALALGRRRAA